MQTKRMMRGTDGDMDYLVVMSKDDLDIGIKPLMSTLGGQVLLMGVRVRGAINPESITQYVSAGKAVSEMFQYIPWSKVNMERASVTGGQTASLKRVKKEGLHEHIVQTEIVSSLAKALNQQAEKLEVDFDEQFMIQFLMGEWENAYAKIMGKDVATAKAQVVNIIDKMKQNDKGEDA